MPRVSDYMNSALQNNQERSMSRKEGIQSSAPEPARITVLQETVWQLKQGGWSFRLRV